MHSVIVPLDDGTLKNKQEVITIALDISNVVHFKSNKRFQNIDSVLHISYCTQNKVHFSACRGCQLANNK